MTDTRALSEDERKLITAAMDVRKRAYAPYSKYHVGAAIINQKGQIFTGVNVENASFGLTVCAERNCVHSAVQAGSLRWQAIAVATENGGSPCGACRQVLREFNPDLTVFICDSSGEFLKQTTIEALLPHSFGPDFLEP